MVARPPLRLRIEPMRLEDLDAVHAIERASFAAPWPANAYRSELESNRLASYLVARADGDIVGYGGMWLMVDEAHITTFAIHPTWRRQRIGERLLLAFLDLAVDRAGARGDAGGPALEPARPTAVREVRVPAGRPPAALLQRRPRGRADHDDRGPHRARDARADRAPPRGARRGAGTDAPGRDRRARRTTRERLARPRDRVVLRRDRRSRSSRAAGRSAATSSPRRSRSTRRRAGSSRRSPPAPTCAGSCRSSTRRGRTPASRWSDIDAVAVTYGPGLAGSLLVGHQHREGARLGPRRAARRGQPPRGPRLRGVARRPGASEVPGARLPARRARRVGRAHVPRRDARPPDVPAARRDRRRRRGRGVRQGRPPARARLPGRAGHLAGGRGRDRARPRLPARLARRLVRLQLLRPQDRGAPHRDRGARRRGAGRRPDGAAVRVRSWPSSPGGSRTPSWTCS